MFVRSFNGLRVQARTFSPCKESPPKSHGLSFTPPCSVVHSRSRSLIDEFERELNLPRVTGSLADFAKTGSVENIRRQAHVDDIEQVEELGAELQIHAFGSAAAPAKGRVFDDSEVEIVVGRSAEGVASQRAEASLVRPCATSNVDRDEKKSVALLAPSPK